MVDKRESITAKLCAFARAWHSNKARNKIYDDYLAYDIMGKEEYDEIYDMIPKIFHKAVPSVSVKDVHELIETYIAPIPLSRIHFSESRLMQFASENESIQYVICGAGSDTFSFRNENPNIEIFEIDHPDTQRYKLEKIQSLEWSVPEHVHFVPVDFEKERMNDKLIQAGFQPNRKTFFSILGVTYYLTLSVFAETLTQIAELSAPESVLVFDYPQRSGIFPERVHTLEAVTRSLGEVMQGGFDYNEVSRALFSLGFQIDTYFTPQKVQAHYFAHRNDGLRAFENVNLLSAIYTGGRDYE